MTGELDWAVAEQTWRASPLVRVVKTAGFAILLVPPELILWLILWGARVPDAGWAALACALVTWMWLAWRTWTQSVMLTRDFVVLGQIIARSEWIALASITAVTFRLGVLTITSRGSRYKVISLPLGASYWS